ncbi:MAG: hypothetical protein ACI35P_16170 [Bacillus sp. (in: firmicutes)]
MKSKRHPINADDVLFFIIWVLLHVDVVDEGQGQVKMPETQRKVKSFWRIATVRCKIEASLTKCSPISSNFDVWFTLVLG